MNKKRSLLKITWALQHQCMSLLELNESLSFIYNSIEIFYPQAILIDFSDFNYRKTPELDVFFSHLKQHFDPGKIAIIIGDRLLGRITLEHIAKQHNNLIIFRKRREAIEWERMFDFSS